MKKYLWPAAAFIIGMLPGFFLVFNFMFTDIISLYERVYSLLIVTATYLILGIAFGLANRGSRYTGGIWLSLPALILALIYSFKEINAFAVNLLYSSAAFGSSLLGFYAGAKLSGIKKH